MPTDVNTKLISLMTQTQNESESSLFSSVVRTREAITQSINDSVSVNDAYGNSLLSIGENDKSEHFSEYSLDNSTLNYPLWLALYNDSWVFRRAIDKPAQDEIRCGITLQGDYDKEQVLGYLSKARSELIHLLQWGALFGGSIAVVMFDTFTDEDYANSETVNRAKMQSASVIRYYVTDRWYGCQQSTETVSKMNDLDFGKPKYYTITFADGKSMKVHHDYVLRYEHRTAPNLIKKGQLQGWGYAEGSHIINELSRDDKLKSSIQSLIDKSLIEVVKMAGMRGVFMGTDEASREQLEKRLEMVNWARNFNSLTFLDKDDDYQQTGFSGLSGLADILEKNMWMISSALEMQGVLFGDLKSGFSNDTEALERYDETINGRCEDYVRPVYEKLLHLLFIVCKIDAEVKFVFNSLLKKQSNEKRMENIKSFVTLLGSVLADGVIDTTLYAKALNNYIVNDEVDFGLTDEEIAKLKDKAENEMEDLNFLGNDNL